MSEKKSASENGKRLRENGSVNGNGNGSTVSGSDETEKGGTGTRTAGIEGIGMKGRSNGGKTIKIGWQSRYSGLKWSARELVKNVKIGDNKWKKTLKIVREVVKIFLMGGQNCP